MFVITPSPRGQERFKKKKKTRAAGKRRPQIERERVRMRCHRLIRLVVLAPEQNTG